MVFRSLRDPILVLIKEELKRLLRLLEKSEETNHTRTIPADIWITPTEVTVRFEIPGADPKTLQLTGNPMFLEVTGVKHCCTPPPGGRYLIAERIIGPFRKAVELPAPVDLGKIQAGFNAGVMTVTCRRIVERRGQRRKIEFTVEE